jgi:Mn2+/Fe2+ NRAMP family transporter
MKNKKIWFKAKHYGWGWYPVTWQGWLITLGFIIFVACAAIVFLTKGKLIEYFASLAIAMVILMYICYKTGEKPRWRWGNNDRRN